MLRFPLHARAVSRAKRRTGPRPRGHSGSCRRTRLSRPRGMGLAHGSIDGVIFDDAQGVVEDLAAERTDLMDYHQALVAEIEEVVEVDLVEMRDEVGKLCLHRGAKRCVPVESETQTEPYHRGGCDMDLRRGPASAQGAEPGAMCDQIVGYCSLGALGEGAHTHEFVQDHPTPSESRRSPSGVPPIAGMRRLSDTTKTVQGRFPTFHGQKRPPSVFVFNNLIYSYIQ